VDIRQNTRLCVLTESALLKMVLQYISSSHVRGLFLTTFILDSHRPFICSVPEGKDLDLHHPSGPKAGDRLCDHPKAPLISARLLMQRSPFAAVPWNKEDNMERTWIQTVTLS
jgi:hypothetical protein